MMMIACARTVQLIPNKSQRTPLPPLVTDTGGNPDGFASQASVGRPDFPDFVVDMPASSWFFGHGFLPWIGGYQTAGRLAAYLGLALLPGPQGDAGKNEG